MRVGVLVSGSGTNLQALIDAGARGELGGAEIACVISNVAEVRALARAHAAGIEAITILHRDFSAREDFERALIAALQTRAIDLVVLAGFMRLLTPVFVRAFWRRIINIHPSLLPAFPGAHAVADALAAGAKKTGVTIHYVDEGVDTGPIIAQREVEILPTDNEQTLLERIHAAEHALYPATLKALAEKFAAK